MRTLHVAGQEYQLHPFDVIIQPRRTTEYAWVGVYAVNDSHAIDLARQALGIHGAMYRVVDVENSRERYLGGDWQATTWL